MDYDEKEANTEDWVKTLKSAVMMPRWKMIIRGKKEERIEKKSAGKRNCRIEKKIFTGLILSVPIFLKLSDVVSLGAGNIDGFQDIAFIDNSGAILGGLAIFARNDRRIQAPIG